jgi:hypothetical protein
VARGDKTREKVKVESGKEELSSIIEKILTKTKEPNQLAWY